ncbi:MAG TPA: NAD(P)-dependent alcohol dehydrogenase [Terriglobales bacterium]|nr:NAD(P)-dependent alcohol dehydrogenase [Terriglobales bacterium]
MKAETNRAHGYATLQARNPLTPFQFERRQPGARDVDIEILYCGICHSDIHQARDEWGGSIFPMVPGHEIAGRVRATGSAVTRYQPGDLVGVGCMVNSCRSCSNCRAGREQFCEVGANFTYNSKEKDGSPTFGGYSDHIVVDEDFVLRIGHNERQLAGVAPLLCAGITTYSPLRRWQAGPGSRVGVVGLGGLGHMAIRLAKEMGAEVTLFTRSRGKQEDALRLGAARVVLSSDETAMQAQHRKLDLIVDTVAAGHDINPYISALTTGGTLVLVGVPDKPLEVIAGGLIMQARTLAGSLIGGIGETQEMLDFCAQRDIVSEVEVIPIQQVNEAYDRVVRSDVKYRFSIEMASLRHGRA